MELLPGSTLMLFLVVILQLKAYQIAFFNGVPAFSLNLTDSIMEVLCIKYIAIYRVIKFWLQGLSDWTQVLRLGGQGFYLLSHLTCPREDLTFYANAWDGFLCYWNPSGKALPLLTSWDVFLYQFQSLSSYIKLCLLLVDFWGKVRSIAPVSYFLLWESSFPSCFT